MVSYGKHFVLWRKEWFFMNRSNFIQSLYSFVWLFLNHVSRIFCVSWFTHFIESVNGQVYNELLKVLAALCEVESQIVYLDSIIINDKLNGLSELNNNYLVTCMVFFYTSELIYIFIHLGIRALLKIYNSILGLWLNIG